jgi:hypothetical protein
VAYIKIFVAYQCDNTLTSVAYIKMCSTILIGILVHIKNRYVPGCIEIYINKVYVQRCKVMQEI